MRTILLNIIILSGLLIGCDFKTTDEYFNDACKKEEQGDYEGAIKDLNIVLKRKPNDIEALINRAIDKKALGRYDDSMQDFNKAMTLDSNNIMALYNRGNLFAETERFKQALEDYNKAIKLKGGENLYFELKDNESFGLRFSDVEMEAIRLQRGLSRAELGDYENAFSDFSFCIENKYGHDLAYLWRGVCYYNLGYLDKACEDWWKSKELGMEEAQDYIIKNCKTNE
ncbi:tetratricopeptide repeat protein [Alkaliflexus imshenetskii]|uniref:tetratricopeptide repeat protein n=1 Tax=Alkaliflexus imshenetskii TaxID=286730 RepID=UPI00047A3698|nr:tetratricopeptide repeat protein [Alkaliflexus imshenetskii]